MNYLTADAGLLSRLRGIVELTEIRDPSGKVLDHYTPVVSPAEAALVEKARTLFDLEEAKQTAAAERHGAPLHEVMRRLRSQEPAG